MKNIASVKTEISKMMQGITPRKRRLYASKDSTAHLLDSAALADHNSIQNDSIWYLVFRKKEKGGVKEDKYDDHNDFWGRKDRQ